MLEKVTLKVQKSRQVLEQVTSEPAPMIVAMPAIIGLQAIVAMPAIVVVQRIGSVFHIFLFFVYFSMCGTVFQCFFSLGEPWTLLRDPWSVEGAPPELLGDPWRVPGGTAGPPWGVPGASLEGPWGPWSEPGASLERPWSDLGVSLERLSCQKCSKR